MYGVVSYAGRGIEGAEVTLDSNMAGFGEAREQDEKKKSLAQVATTNGRGEYRFNSVTIKNFQVSVNARGYGRQTQNNRAFLTNEPEHEINFDLTPENIVTGMVVDERHRPIEGATVTASLVGSSFRSESTAETRPDGTFMVQRLSDGQYHLSAAAEGFSPATKPKIEAGTADVELVMLPQGSVSGVVVDENSGSPLDDFTIVVLRSFTGREPASSGPRHRFSAAGGSFQIGGLDPNTYVLEAQAPGYASSRSEEFSARRGEVTTDVAVNMNRGGTIAGRVTDDNGDPIRGARVELNPNGFQWNPVHDILIRMSNDRVAKQKTRTDAEGNYQIELIVPGIYQVAANHPDYSTSELNDIQVVKNQMTQVPAVALPVGAAVEGYCYTEAGALLPGATVSVVSTKQDYYQGRCNPEGYFKIQGLKPGDYTVQINNFVADPPVNVLVQMLMAKNSSQSISVTDGVTVMVELRLSSERPDSGR